MIWKKPIIETLCDVLRFSVWSCLILNGMLASVFSVYFVARFLWHLHHWCDRVLFGHDW